MTPKRAFHSLLLAILTACSRAEPAVDYVTLFESINAGETAALQAGNPTKAASYFAEDGVVLPPSGNVISGREAITAFWGSGTSRIVELNTRTIAAGGSGNTGYLSGEYQIATQTRAESPQRAHGTFLMVFHKRGQRWEITQDIWTAAP